MKVPVGLKVAALVVVTTAFYTYVGQLVPQKEVPAPQVIEIAKDVSTEELVEIGRELASREGKGQCLTCHTIGSTGAAQRYPDLQGIATRAATRIEGMSALEYLAQSMYEPEAYLVPGFAGGMPIIDKPPIGLNDQEIRAVLAWLQSLGGTPTMTLETPISYQGGAPAKEDGAEGAAGAPAGAEG